MSGTTRTSPRTPMGREPRVARNDEEGPRVVDRLRRYGEKSLFPPCLGCGASGPLATVGLLETEEVEQLPASSGLSEDSPVGGVVEGGRTAGADGYGEGAAAAVSHLPRLSDAHP